MSAAGRSDISQVAVWQEPAVIQCTQINHPIHDISLLNLHNTKNIPPTTQPIIPITKSLQQFPNQQQIITEENAIKSIAVKIRITLSILNNN